MYLLLLEVLAGVILVDSWQCPLHYQPAFVHHQDSILKDGAIHGELGSPIIISHLEKPLQACL